MPSWIYGKAMGSLNRRTEIFDTFFYTACHTNVDCNFSKHHHHQLRWPTFSCAPTHHPNRQFHSHPNAHDAFLGSKRWWLLPPNQRIVWAWFWFKGGLVYEKTQRHHLHLLSVPTEWNHVTMDLENVFVWAFFCGIFKNIGSEGEAGHFINKWIPWKRGLKNLYCGTHVTTHQVYTHK